MASLKKFSLLHSRNVKGGQDALGLFVDAVRSDSNRKYTEVFEAV